ncbi:hypothetical protein D3P07_20160 [Paenibacillus sp. 1011MAR3C5]|uniref:hypothetical protein n=1 Tax=Paenibacillus sp. 1011MAR3C5 TaxID=1675787 RepID=UPI000E6BCE5A|nr:hypothetical protein [Paenibacillus sp. 1011MAR3C5]RJE85520.1 hypothetical protein D3P07_20160 [Paenibacillus sp. 1011MAR3C5]
MISPFFKKKESSEKPSDQPQDLAPGPAPEQADLAIEAGDENKAYGANVPDKAKMDKKSLDLIFAVEQMIQAKQHTELQVNELQDRLAHAGGNIERLNRDARHLNKVIEEREKSIHELEQKIVDKNMKVDQVVEDYRELQRKMSTEIEELKSVIELEQQKYNGLLQKHNDTLGEKNKRIHELEEKMGRQEVENQHLKQKYDATHQEKVYLANMISDFTNRMSAPLGRDN